MTTNLLAAAGLALLLAQCRPAAAPAPAAPTPLELLPPATQSGARTFGCLLNGQAWTPAGQVLAGPLFTASYIRGNFYLTANRAIIVNGANSTQRIQLEMDSIKSAGSYKLINSTSRTAEFSDREKSCLFTSDPAHPAYLTITRLDPVNRIVSGTFAFTLEQPGCGTITVTDGRFDYPY